MTRYSADHKARTRKRIVRAAARRFRKRGYGAAGVDEVMEAAGLTAGGFYLHFDSKRELLAETLQLALAQLKGTLLAGTDELPDLQRLRAVVGRYLSREHRDHPADGCALPALASEIAREGPPARKALEEYVVSLVELLAPRMPAGPGLSPDDRVLATVALLTGGLLLARAVDDPELSERILRASRRLAVPELANEAAKRR